MVIDVLNFRPQMEHQLNVWGAYSDQIHDYSSKGLIKQGDETAREEQLRVMMDPYTYRSVLKLPKLLVNGTNDKYWVVDAMKLYWPDLVGPKFVLQIPNAGHGLGGGGDRVGATIAAFFRHVVRGREFPQIDWKPVQKDGNVGLQVNVVPNPRNVKLWRAQSSSGDFRESRWSSEPMQATQAGYVGWVAKPTNGDQVAYFGELEFESEGQTFWLSTVVQRQ
jgi:PhoPQ-activated pathogenicity-related protein